MEKAKANLNIEKGLEEVGTLHYTPLWKASGEEMLISIIKKIGMLLNAICWIKLMM